MQMGLLLACPGKVLFPFLRMGVSEYGSAFCKVLFLQRTAVMLDVQLVILIPLPCKAKREADFC